MGDKQGFWEPHTSSIDFCEPNYVLNDKIVEIHNVWSSLIFISGLGIFGLMKGNPSKEWRFSLTYSILTFIGIGSAFLHATLHWIFQSSDELPMLYIVICLGYSVLECETPRKQNKSSWIWCILLAFILTIVYYRFQHLYFIFIFTFTLGTVVTTVRYVKLAYKTKEKTGCKHITWLFWLAEAYFTGIGVSVWIFDMLLCDRIVLPIANCMPSFLQGLTPHVLWHLASALGTYVLTSSLCCCRLAALGLSYTVSYHLGGMIPIIHPETDASTKKVI